MTLFVRFIGVWAFAALSLGAMPAAGYGTQAIENPWTLCARHTQKREREQHIPHRLLRAISLAEAGRWHPDTGEISAWPWTVMAERKGQFFDTKQAALDWVHKLQARGVKNIDVGCMQINLFHHGHQFPSLEHAFDPEYNTRYAAKFLKEKYAAARSWTIAAGHYHSTNSVKNTPYRRKVFQFWHGQSRQKDKKNQTGQQWAQQDTTRTLSPFTKRSTKKKLSRPVSQRIAIDRKRTQMLNARFRQSNAGVFPKSTDSQSPVLQDPNTVPSQPAVFSSKRSLKKITRANGNGKIDTFTERRRTQLQQWRQTGAWRARKAGG